MTTALTISITLVVILASCAHCESSKHHGSFNKNRNGTYIPMNNVRRAQTTAEKTEFEEDQQLMTKNKNKYQKKMNIFGKAFQKHPRLQDEILTEAGSNRGGITSLASSANVKGALIEKGIEVAGKLIDKQIENIEQAQEKAADFLKKKINLDISPGKGWDTEDMFKPPNYQIKAEMEDDSRDSEDDQKEGDKINTYAHGIGGVIMNGCWGSGYKQGDPCFDALKATDYCKDLIDGAAFIGVGFDGRGEYSPESRKMSIIQRSCAGMSSYDGLEVPDTMNVHGIYETSAQMTVFSSREEYQKYLEKEAGISGSVLGFYSGVKKAWGSSESSAEQKNMALFDIDIDRYEIFKDEVKPEDLSRSFLREFVNLPNDYFTPGGPVKYQDFILRWGTHYIKSARFGGRLEIRKLQLAKRTASKRKFAEESETEFKSLFYSGGSRSSTKAGQEQKSEKKFMSTSVVVNGGSQDIAAIISDLYSPTFKTEFQNWLDSIPTYPKAFKFLMGPITDLLNFRVHDLFPEESFTWQCEVRKDELTVDKDSGKYYYEESVNGKSIKRYCEFGNREEMALMLNRKLQNLKRAIEIYMEEGSISMSDVSIPGGESGCESGTIYKKVPSWDQITKVKDEGAEDEDESEKSQQFRVTFDMKQDLKKKLGSNSSMDIPKDMSRFIKYRYKKWFTSNRNGKFRLYDGFSANIANKKISIFGLVLTYKTDGSLVLESNDYDASKEYFSNLDESLKDKQLAQISWSPKQIFINATKIEDSITHLPCNIKWSNVLRVNPSDSEGKCIHFTASSKGPLYVVLAEIPSKEQTWYYVEISPYGTAIYKAKKMKVSTVNTNALALGDDFLYQSYFVCITESEKGTVIEYGKAQDANGGRDVYLTLIDHEKPLRVRFFSFANGEYRAQVMDIHNIARNKLQTRCKGETQADVELPICVQQCHEACDPFQGCKSSLDGVLNATECNACRFAKTEDTCVLTCPEGQEVRRRWKICWDTYDLKIERVPEISFISPNYNEDIKTFTICLWFQPSAFRQNSLVEYFFQMKNIRMNKILLRTYLKKNADANRLDVISDVLDMQNTDSKANEIYREVKATLRKDNKWHMYCVARNSYPGHTTAYIDGKPSQTKQISYGVSMFPFSYVELGETDNLSATYRGWLTGFNMWKRVLTDEEISEMSETCSGAAGDFFEWPDVFNMVLGREPPSVSKKSTSQCKV